MVIAITMLWRRTRSLLAFALVFALLMTTWPLLGLIAVVRDVIVGARLGATRFLGVLLFYSLMEAAGLMLALGFWLGRPFVSRARYLSWHHGMQTWWASWLLRFLLWIYRVKVEVEGAENAAEGPYILLMRHASMGDTLLPIRFLQAVHGMRLRYVLKAELMWEPCLDIVGHRLPNVFVTRGSGDSEAQRQNVAELARDLGPGDGVVLFPEGTRFSRRRRERLIQRLEERGESARAQLARTLEHVLPIRHGGPTALLRMQPGVDVVFGAHIGFEGATRLPDLLSGALLDRRVRVAFWRESTAHLKTDAEIADWLDAQWQRIDAWVAERA